MTNHGAQPSQTDTIEISVIVPIFEQWELLPILISALQAQEFPRQKFEVLIIRNDASQTPLPENTALNLIGLDCDIPGSYASRNMGLENARGKFIAFTDADCVPSLQWLSELWGAHQTSPNSLLAGPIHLSPEGAPEFWEIYDAVRGIPQEKYVKNGYGACANLAVSAEIAAKTGGFESGRLSGGDAVFCRAAGALGYGVQLVPNAIVGHPARRGRQAAMQKARRIKGGQITSGPVKRRIMWAIRSLVPPLRDSLRFARSPHPISWRLKAICAVHILWLVGIIEMFRLCLGATPERR